MEPIDLLRFYRNMTDYLHRQDGQALSEYSITLTLLVIVTIAAITAMGQSIFDLLQNSVNALMAL